MDIIKHRMSLRYLFYLKTLELVKSRLKREIERMENECQELSKKISNLAISKEIIRPNVYKPGNWYSIEYAGKWLIPLGLSIAIGLIVIDSRGIWGPLFSLISACIFIYSAYKAYKSYQSNLRKSNIYTVTIKQYNASLREQKERVKLEEAEKNIKQEDLRKKEKELDELSNYLKKINIARDLLYSVDYIPYQFRNFRSVVFFYSQVQSSPILLDELIQYEGQRVENGYKDIKYRFTSPPQFMCAYAILQRSNFWEECRQVASEVSADLMTQKEGENLDEKFRELSEKVGKVGSGITYAFYGSVGAVAGVHIGNNEITAPMSDYSLAMESEAENEYLKGYSEKFAEQIAQKYNSETAQELLEKLEAQKPQLMREKLESYSACEVRIKDTLKEFATSNGILEIWLSVLSQIEKSGTYDLE